MKGKYRAGTAFLACITAVCAGAGSAGAISICIDPGHGGDDPGAIGCNLKEAEVTLEVSKKLQTLMKNAGYTVYMTRTDNSTVSLAQRSSYANSKGVDTFASIHNNSAASTATGIETYCYTNNLSKTSGTQAKNIQAQMVAVWPLTNRGAKEANFHVVRETNMPATLSELAFINNCDKDAKYLASDAHRLEAAQAHCKALVAQWGGNASACTGSGGGQQTQKTGNVCGYVTDGVSAGAGNKLDGASYTCGGKTLSSSSSTVSKFELPVGSYTCSASKSGYTTNTRKDCAAVTEGTGCTAWCSVNIPPAAVVTSGTMSGTVSDSVSKAKIPATVSVAGGPSTSYDGKTNWSFSLAGGSYTVKASSTGYDDNSVTCNVTNGTNTPCTITLNPRKATIHGNVRDSESGAGVAGIVALGSASTNYDGTHEWSFTVDAGTYTVTATADGYESGSAQCSAGKGESVTCDVSITKIKHENQAPGLLRGTLTDEDTGDLIAGTVTLENGDISYYNGLGSWQFYLAPGTYRVTGAADGYDDATVTCGVSTGQETTCPLRLAPHAVHTSGAIYDAVSKENVPAQVTIRDDEGNTVAELDYDGTDNWTADLRPGTYTVSISADGYDDRESLCRIDPGDDASCDFGIAPIGTKISELTGIVHDARSELYLLAAEVRIDGVGSTTYNPYAQDCAEDACRTWRFGELTPGPYTVTASAPGYFSNTVNCEVLPKEAGSAVCRVPLTARADADNPVNIETGVAPVVTYISDDASCSASPLRRPGGTAAAFLLALSAACGLLAGRKNQKGDQP